MIIAIDGPAASGKGTLAKRLARHFGLAHLDTGSLYRAVAAQVLANRHDPGDVSRAVAAARSLKPGTTDEAVLRSREVSDAASIVAAMPDVRAAILAYQRKFAQTPPGAVLDGRDIGTVVCPDADIKLFVTASTEARAERRFKELEPADPGLEMADVLASIEARDRRDRTRATAPLKQAEDALLLDTSNLDIEAAFQAAVEMIDRKL
jgi:cytidylate kinase